MINKGIVTPSEPDEESTSKHLPESNVAITIVNYEAEIIEFWAVKEVLPSIREFGYVHHLGEGRYQIRVDPRFRFEEVVDYVQDL